MKTASKKTSISVKSQSSSGTKEVDEVLKYVDLEGRAAIQLGSDVNGEVTLKLIFLNGELKPDPTLEPIFFYGKDDFGNQIVRFKHVHLTAEFNKKGFDDHVETLKAFNPLLEEWDKLENSDGTLEMNPSGPPKSR